MKSITTCSGTDCPRRETCFRQVCTEEHDVERLCYSYFSFFEENWCPVFFDQEGVSDD